jgi:hypothetical protein
MELTKKLTTVYTASVKPFIGFYELRCSIADETMWEEPDVIKDLCPKGTSENILIPNNDGLRISLWFDNELGRLPVYIDIDFLSGYVEVTFDSVVYTNISSSEAQISEKDFTKLVRKYLPVVESFLDTLAGLERNFPCEKKCHYNKLRDKEGRCYNMYYSYSYNTAHDVEETKITPRKKREE